MKNAMLKGRTACNFDFGGLIMNIERLKIFTDLAGNLSYTQTAMNAHLSQPAISQAIKALEAEIGFQLLDRNQHQVSLTAAGQVFLQKISPLLEQFDLSVENSRMVAERVNSGITIGYTGTIFETQILPIVIKKFNQEHPQLNVYLANFKQNYLKNYLLEGQCDLIFQTADAVQDSNRLSFTALQTGGFVCAMPKNHPLALKKFVTMADLNDETIILLNEQQCPPEQKKVQNCVKNSCDQATYCYSDSVLLSYTMVKNGLGISILPDFVIGESQTEINTVPIKYETTLTYGIAKIKDQEDPMIDKFVQQIIELSK